MEHVVSSTLKPMGVPARRAEYRVLLAETGATAIGACPVPRARSRCNPHDSIRRGRRAIVATLLSSNGNLGMEHPDPSPLLGDPNAIDLEVAGTNVPSIQNTCWSAERVSNAGTKVCRRSIELSDGPLCSFSTPHARPSHRSADDIVCELRVHASTTLLDTKSLRRSFGVAQYQRRNRFTWRASTLPRMRISMCSISSSRAVITAFGFVTPVQRGPCPAHRSRTFAS
jgi:hypothetical protein